MSVTRKEEWYDPRKHIQTCSDGRKYSNSKLWHPRMFVAIKTSHFRCRGLLPPLPCLKTRATRLTAETPAAAVGARTERSLGRLPKAAQLKQSLHINYHTEKKWSWLRSSKIQPQKTHVSVLCITVCRKQKALSYWLEPTFGNGVRSLIPKH